MARSSFIVRQAVLDLVASDFSYKPTGAIGVGPTGDRLKSFPDNAPGDDVGFPSLLLNTLDQSLASPYHALPVSSIPPQIYEFDNWHVAKTFNHPPRSPDSHTRRMTTSISTPTRAEARMCQSLPEC